MRGLEGRRVVVAGSRKTEEIGTLISKMGGVPVMRPAQGTMFPDDEQIGRQIARFVHTDADWLILTTGIGTEAIFKQAAEMGLNDSFRSRMDQTKIAARGYKTVNAMKKYGLVPALRDDDGSMAGLMREMEEIPLEGKTVFVQFYGDPAPKLTGWLHAKGAQVEEILPYRHVPPEPDVLDTLLGELLDDELDAVAFTSTPQVRFLFGHAKQNGRRRELLQKFEAGTVALAVGKVTADALREEGVSRIVVPQMERIGSMIVALSEHFGNS